MAFLIGLNFRCPDCGGLLGLSTRLLAEYIVREESPDGDVSETDVNALSEKAGILEPFVVFPLMLDPATMTVYLSLWCQNCGGAKNTSISVENIKELARMPENN